MAKQGFVISATESVARALARGDERARIRRELLEEIGGLTHFVEWRNGRSFAADDPWISAADLRTTLDRICPEEGQAK